MILLYVHSQRPLTKSISSSSNISVASTSRSTESPQRTPSLQSLKVPVPLFKPTLTPLVNYSAIQEVVLFVGVSGSGKSTFYEKIFKSAGYAWVNQDTLKTRDKCLSAVTDEISKGGKVVVDNTNTSVEVRKSYIAIAQTHKIPIRCVQFHVDLEVCQQNNLFRSHQNVSESLCSCRYFLHLQPSHSSHPISFRLPNSIFSLREEQHRLKESKRCMRLC